MKVVFNGIMESKQSGGCTSCGQRAKTEHSFKTSKSYILPSGLTKTFTMGQVEEVSDKDGQFLLSYIEHTKDGQRKVFEEV